jgi:lantibiotic modifying enzyme
MAHLGTLWRDPQILAEVVDMLDEVAHRLEQDRELDIVAGSAGCIAGLLSLSACVEGSTNGLSSTRAMETAVRCGEHLLSLARQMPQGVAWDSPFPTRAPLTGFSHGAAGIGWALLTLAARSGDERFRAAGIGAIAYERNVFSPRDQNWPDLRATEDAPAANCADDEAPVTDRPQTPHGPLSWCHGAPGIGLARLRCRRSLNDPMLRQEIETAVEATLAGGFAFNHALCHGDLGNLELLSEATRAFPDAPWRDRTDRVAAGILQSIETDGWRCANPMQIESPGLMTGLAGIGYALLRQAEPERVPSVLMLDPPIPSPVIDMSGVRRI